MESWKNITGFTTYQVSDLGRIRSLPKKVNSKHGFRTTRVRILTPTISHGYEIVMLDNKRLRVHRLVALMFKSSIEKLAAALFMFVGNDYKEDDVVYVDGKPGRIVRVGLTKTVFFIYDVVDGKVLGGSKLVVQNERLASLNIEKPLANLDLSRFKKNE